MSQKNIKYTRQELDEAINTIKSDLNILELQNCDLNTAYYFIDQRGIITDHDTMVDGTYVKNIKTGELIKLTEAQRTNPKYNFIYWLKANSHNYLAKLNTSTGNVILKQLSNTNRKQYANGTDATLDVTDLTSNNDVIMKFPCDIYFKIEAVIPPNDTTINPNYLLVTISKIKPSEEETGWQKYSQYNLIGAYESVHNTQYEKTNSLSGGKPLHFVYASAHIQQAKNKGIRYNIEDYDTHRIILILFYGYYNTLDCKSVCGHGTNSSVAINTYKPKVTGLTDNLGMTDTNVENGSYLLDDLTTEEIEDGNGPKMKSINFWGLENVWGNVCEALCNVRILSRAMLKSKLSSQNSITVVWDAEDIVSYTSDTIADFDIKNTSSDTFVCIYNRDCTILERAISVSYTDACPIGTLLFNSNSDVVPDKSVNNFNMSYTSMQYYSNKDVYAYRSGWSGGNETTVNGVAFIGTFDKDAAGLFMSASGSRIVYYGDENSVIIED